MKFKKNPKGFTLIELILLMFIVILMVFLGVMFTQSFLGHDFSLEYPENLNQVKSISIDEGFILTTISLSYLDNSGDIHTKNYWKFGLVFLRDIHWVKFRDISEVNQ